MKALRIEEKVLGHKAILSEIGRAKDSLLSPAEFAVQAGSDFRLKKVAECYTMYQKRLQEADAMDFDDLLCRTVELFIQCPDVLERYQSRYRYMMVDEYQDTNHAQYKLISMLAAKSGNLCVVGDDDQSIYKFRGATIENILSFEDEFADCTVIRLEQNYRSTKTILNAANAVIAKNVNRKGKTLWTDNPEGDDIQIHSLDNEDEEGPLYRRHHSGRRGRGPPLSAITPCSTGPTPNPTPLNGRLSKAACPTVSSGDIALTIPKRCGTPPPICG